jgi:hypothetical protein
MSYIDDTCDFCGDRFDPMGDPWLLNTRKGIWDGCKEGRDSLFGELSTEKLTKTIDERLRQNADTLTRIMMEVLAEQALGKS